MTPLLRSGLLLPVLGASLAGQGIRVDQKLERPLFYLAQQAPAAGGEDVMAALRDDPRLSGLLGWRGGVDSRGGVEGAAVVDSVQQLLSRLSQSSTANELALVGVLPLGDRSRPLVVFHSQLREGGAAEMRALLASGRFTRPTRTLHGRQVYRIGPDAGAVEVALVDSDLVVSNNGDTMQQMLDPRTVAGGGFAARPRYARMRRELPAPPGSVLLYADWGALRPHVGDLFGGDAAWALQWSGIEVPEQVMFVMRPAPRKAGQRPGIVTSFLLQHTSDSYKFSGGTSAKEIRERRFDGWLDLLVPERARNLVATLSRRPGLAAVSSMLDFQGLLRTHRGKRWMPLQASYLRYANHVDLDLRTDVLRRLEPVGSAQLVMVGDGLSVPRLAFTVRARSPKKAEEVFASLSRAFVGHRDAEERDAEGVRVLQFRQRRAGRPLVLGVVQDSLVLAYDAAVVARLAADAEQLRRPTSANKKRDAALLDRVQRLGVSRQKKIIGLFALDLRELAAGLGGREGQEGDPMSGLLGLHAGYFGFDQDLVRLEVFTQL